MGGAGREGLEAALGGGDPRDGGDDEEVGSKYEHRSGDDIRSHKEMHQSLVAILVATS